MQTTSSQRPKRCFQIFFFVWNSKIKFQKYKHRLKFLAKKQQIPAQVHIKDFQRKRDKFLNLPSTHISFRLAHREQKLFNRVRTTAKHTGRQEVSSSILAATNSPAWHWPIGAAVLSSASLPGISSCLLVTLLDQPKHNSHKHWATAKQDPEGDSQPWRQCLCNYFNCLQGETKLWTAGSEF